MAPTVARLGIYHHTLLASLTLVHIFVSNSFIELPCLPSEPSLFYQNADWYSTIKNL